MATYEANTVTGLDSPVAIALATHLIGNVFPTVDAARADLKSAKAATIVTRADLIRKASEGSNADAKALADTLTKLVEKANEITASLRTLIAPDSATDVDRKAVAATLKAALSEVDNARPFIPAEWLAANGYGESAKTTRPRVKSVTLSGAASGTFDNFTLARQAIKGQTGTDVDADVLKANWLEASGADNFGAIESDVTFTLDVDGKAVTVTVTPKVAA